MKNWKTNLAGIFTLMIGLGHIGFALTNGEAISAEDIGLVTAAMGAFAAKDSNVTGGTVPATAEAVART